MSKQLQTLALGTIHPAGWIRKQMEKDLDGFVGHLDQLAPELMIDDRIYGEHRLTAKIKDKSVGNIQPDDEWISQYLWWNSESQSNWGDGYLRHAFLLDDKKHLQRINEHIRYILSTQDEDGYIGIYAPDLRYRFQTENGELWSKATLYRVLLAYYEATGDAKVLNAVIRAVQNVMDNYPINSSSPFLAEKSYAGVSHGLMFTDVLDKLSVITRQKTYSDYAVFLFRDYCKHDVSEKDVQLKNIFDETYKLLGHGVHTYEHLRSLAVAYFATHEPELEKALAIYLQRIETSTTPSGGPAGDEWIFERSGHATDTGYEYCSIQELMDSYLLLFIKTGDALFAEKVEKIFLNAAQGARHPEHSSIAYLKTDNSYEMCGTRNGEIEPNKKQTRYKYSPVHQDVAICCSPNAGRITPYYVQHMWMKDDDGLIACLFGPCETEIMVDNSRITVKEITAYPYDFSVSFEITAMDPVDFTLKIRKPGWANSVKLNVPFKEEKGFICIKKEWNGLERVTIEFEPVVVINTSFDKEVYFSYGPLVLAHPIEAIETRTKEYGIKDMFDAQYKPVKLVEYIYCGGGVAKKGTLLDFEVELLNKQSGMPEKVSLAPIGKTILRQVSFKQEKAK
jgi:DUF1680 family protein